MELAKLTSGQPAQALSTQVCCLELLGFKGRPNGTTPHLGGSPHNLSPPQVVYWNEPEELVCIPIISCHALQVSRSRPDSAEAFLEQAQGGGEWFYVFAQCVIAFVYILYVRIH